MRIFIGAELSPIRGGIEARAPELRMCGHGPDREGALDSLRRGVRAWVIGLQQIGNGQLESAIAARGLNTDPHGDAVEISIEEL